MSATEAARAFFAADLAGVKGADPGLDVPASEAVVVTLEQFIAEDEPGAAALVGDENSVLIPEDGDVMLYGDGGAGKTTLSIDLACHLAAGARTCWESRCRARFGCL